MANRRFIDFPIASTVGDNDIVLIWQSGVNKQTTKATFLSGLPENLEDLNDVVISGLTNGQILRYDSVTGKWENTDQGNLDLNDLNDVSIVSPSNGQVLVYNSSTSKWENSSGGFVPYVGAVTTVDLGAQGLRAGYVRFDTSVASVPDEQGLMYWDASRSTAALIMNGTLQHIGQDSFFYVKNSSGSTIPKGTCVRFAGTDGASGHLLVTPFLANGSVPSTYFMGVTAEAITNGSFGQVMHFGELTGINTSGFTAGDLLYASTTVAGGFQTTVPVAPNNIVLVAAAVNSKNNGAIVVRPTYGSNINSDEGVKITSPTTGDLLQLQAGGLWENKTKAQILGGTSSQFVKGDGSLDSTSYQPLLTNPVTGTGTTNYLPKFTGSTTIGNSIVQDVGIRIDIGGDIRLTPSSAVNIQAYTGSVYTNLFYNAASHNWQTSGGATKMFLNSNDNLLIGTTTDGGQRLQVTGTFALRAFASGSSATQIPIFNADPSGTTRELVTRTPAQLLSDIGGQAALTNPVTGTGTTNYLPKFTGSTTIGNSNLINDASGNLGLGVTPSAWNSAYRAMQFGTTGAIFGESGDAANYFTTNTFVDSVGFKYITSDWALGYFQENGVHSWRNAPSGTAGNAISFTQAMTLTSGGNLLVGTTSDNGARLQVSGTATVSGNGLFGGATALTGLNGGISVNGASNSGINFRTSDVLRGYVYTTSGNMWVETVSGSVILAPNGSPALTLASTGAATFSSSVTAKGTGNYNGFIADNSSSATIGGGYYAANSFGVQRGLFAVAGAISGTTDNNIGIFAEGGLGIKFFVNGSGTASHMMTSSGNVGIGTSSPNATLQVRGDNGSSVSAVMRLRDTNSTSRTTRLQFEDYNGTLADGIIDFKIPTAGSATGARLDIGVDSAIMSLVRGGNVLIGTTTDAGYKLDVNGFTQIRGGSSFAALILNDSRAGGVDFGIYNGFPAAGDFTIRESGVANHLVIKKTSGNVWIGNDSNPLLEIANGGSTDVLSGIRWSIGGSRVDYGGIYSATSSANNNYISFYTKNSASAPSERMRITSSGNVLIGTTTNGSSKLKINGLPTSSAGLASGDVWNDGGTLKIA